MAKAKKSPARKDAKSQPSTAPAAPTGLRAIDTSLAAQTAARMLAARAKLKAPLPAPAGPARESASFKELKEHLLQRPAAHVASSAMGAAFGPQKTNLPPTGQQGQVYHNQTQSSVNRINVPRRTAG